MTAFRLNAVGWAFQLVGTFFLLLDSVRMGIRLPREGIRLGDPPELDRWIYHWASSIGFASLFIGFVVCGIALWLSRPKNFNIVHTTPETSPRPSGNAPASDTNTLLWQRRNQQDNLIHTRLNWFIVSQSFLFTAYAISQGKDNAIAKVFGRMIPGLGLLVTLAVYVSIIGGIATFYWFREKLREFEPNSPLHPPRGFLNHWLWVGFCPALFVPFVFFAAWAYLLWIAW